MSEDIVLFLFENAKILSIAPTELKCLLCKKVMLNPSYPPCGCEFCNKCICSYLDNDHNKCPGGHEECSRRSINTDDIVNNPVTKKKILRLLVKCTNEFCDYEGSVMNMIGHLEKCDKVKECCPYGCRDNVAMQQEELRSHLSEYQIDHTKTLITRNKELQARVEQLEMEKNHLNNENVRTKEKLGHLESVVDQIQNKLVEQNSNINEFIKQTATEFVKRDKFQYDNLIQLGDKYNKDRGFPIKVGICSIKVVELTKDISEIQTFMATNRNRMDQVNMFQEISTNNLCPFKWTIDNLWSVNSKIYSPPFYTDEVGYKMRVGIEFIKNHTAIQGIGQILSGKNDERIVWPCTKFIRLHLTKQLNGNTFKWMNISFTFETSCRPRNESNLEQIGEYKLAVEDLQKDLSVTKHNKLIFIVDICQL